MSSSLKRLCHLLNIWTPTQLNQYLLCMHMRKWFLNFYPTLFKIIIKLLLVYWKHLQILKIVPKAVSNLCSGFLSLSLVDFYLCKFMAGFRNNFHTRGGFPNNFHTGGYQKAEKSSLNRVTGRIFTICKWFHRSKQKLYFLFTSQQDSWKLWKP